MAYYSIEKRMRADGTARYRCTVGIKEKGKVIYRENKTFSKLQIAKTWGTRRVSHIEEHGIPDINDTDRITLRDLITRYINDPNLGGKAGRTKKYVLNMLVDSDIANISLADLTTHHIIEHCRLRAASGAGPSTLGHDISYLRSVLGVAKPIYGINITDITAVSARMQLVQMGLVGKSNRRTRRPIGDELDKLASGLQERSEKQQAHIPYLDILNFSILSCMRVGEICKILWSDVDEEQRAVIVRDRKDPRKKDGNHMAVPLLGDAWSILNRQEKKDERIFPYNSRSVSAGFQRVRDRLGIKDLKYHDLRREGASRLLEQGFALEEVAQVTGHRNLQTLWLIYISIFPNTLHDKFDSLTKKNEKTS